MKIMGYTTGLLVSLYLPFYIWHIFSNGWTIEEHAWYAIPLAITLVGGGIFLILFFAHCIDYEFNKMDKVNHD